MPVSWAKAAGSNGRGSVCQVGLGSFRIPTTAGLALALVRVEILVNRGQGTEFALVVVVADIRAVRAAPYYAPGKLRGGG